MSIVQTNNSQSWWENVLVNGLPSAIETQFGGSQAQQNQAAFTEQFPDTNTAGPDRATLATDTAKTEKMMLYVGGGVLLLVGVVIAGKLL